MTTATLASGHSDTTTATQYTNLLAAGGRVLIAAIFILSGFSKIADPSATLAYIQSAGLPLPQFALAAAITVEVGGGMALLAGVRTRTVALIMAGFSVATALAFHNHLADQNQFIHFFKNVAMTGGLLQVVAFGPGRIAFDRA
jgi:putative oxidoreductase